MLNEDITVLIRTINRPTLSNAINSAKSEFKNVIVIADAVDLNFDLLPKDVLYLKNGKKFDQYGSAAINMGAFATSTEYFCLLDDDDEFIPGAGNFMQSAIRSNPEVDIWIPGLKYNDGFIVCIHPAVQVGNVAIPTYKTKLLFEYPFSSRIMVEQGNPHWIDFSHVRDLVTLGHTIGWYGQPLVNIRPLLEGKCGFGM